MRYLLSLLMGLLVALFVSGQAEATEGPVAYWPMNEGRGHTITDEVSGLEGKINGAKWTEGLLGSGLEFDGVDDTANLGNAPSLAISQGKHTIEMWVIVFTSRNRHGIWSKTIYYTRRIGLDEWAGKVILVSTGGEGAQGAIAAGGSMPVGAWFHVVTTIDTVNQSAKIYVDGKLQAEDTAFSLADTTSANFVLGSKGIVKDGFFKGVIDEVAIYDRVLTEAEIKQKYMKGEDGQKRLNRLRASVKPKHDYIETEPDLLKLSRDGQSVYRVVIADKAEEPIPAAAKELVRFFKEITGAQLPIVTDAQPMTEHEIIIGPSRHLDNLAIYIDWENLGKEGYVIRTVGNHLALFGGPRRGTLNAVYTFLEDTLGCRWYTPTFSVIPKNPGLVIEPLHVERVPELESRHMTDYASSDPAWAARQRVNTFAPYNIGWLLYDNPLTNPKKLPHNLDGIRSVLADPRLAKAIKYGCRAQYSWAHYHTMGPGSFSDFFPANEYFKEHPEYYGMDSDGKRDGDPKTQRTMCLTNPDVFRIAVQKAKRYLSRVPGANIVSVSNADSDKYCRCQKCKQAGEKYTYKLNKNPLGYFPYGKLDTWANPLLTRPAWDPGESVRATGVLLDFVNRVAEELVKDQSDVLIHTFAYHWTMFPPDNIKIHPNVVIDVAPWVQCSYHTLSGCSYNEPFHGWWTAVRRWRKLTPHVWLWRYDQGRRQGMLPRPTLKNLDNQFREMAQAGVRGAQLHTYQLYPWVWMRDLRSYLIAKLMWNPWYDMKKGMEEFLGAYYGPGAGEILAYLTESQETDSYVGTDQISWREFKGFHSSMSGPDIRPEVIRKWDKRFDRAETIVAEHPNFLKRVRTARLSIDFGAIRFLDAGDPVRVRAFREFPSRAKEAGMKDGRMEGLLEEAAKARDQ